MEVLLLILLVDQIEGNKYLSHNDGNDHPFCALMLSLIPLDARFLFHRYTQV